MATSDSVFVAHTACSKCGSSDANSLYSDGHTHCFSCDTTVAGDADNLPELKPRKKWMSEDLLPRGEYKDIPSRSISAETCRKFGYSVGETGSGKPCHIAEYRDGDGHVVAQHLRLKGKKFPWIGEKDGATLFGQHAARDGATKVIITEGEIDAMSVHEIVSSGRSNRWASVSIKSGAKGAKKDLADQLQWLEKSDEIILMFDNDEPGQEAALECARIFKPGKCKIAKLPLKDANDMLRAGRGHEVIDAIFSAKKWRPEGIVSIGDVREAAMSIPKMGLPWFVGGLNTACYGRQYGELVGLAAGTGVGKTDFITQQIMYDLTELNLKVGIFFLEQQPYETVQRLAGKLKGQRFHVPPDKLEEPWSPADLAEAIDELDMLDGLRMYDHFGVADYDLIEENIRHLYHSEGIRIFYIDHLTALAAQAENEKDELERIMSCLGGLVKEIPIWVLYVSHLTTPEGKPHEEGGRVMIRHFKGSRSIGFWSHRMYGLERNQQADDLEERQTTILRCLKDRPVGSANGTIIRLGYDENAGRLFEKTGGGEWGDEDDDPPF